MSGTSWSPTHIQMLRQVYREFPPPAPVPTAEVAQLLGKPVAAVHRKALQLGLTGSGRTQSTGRWGAKGGMRDDLGLFVRSTWEANYARYLNWLAGHGEIDRWEFEPKVFEFPVKRGIRSYCPDFRVWLSGGYQWHEVKGWMDDASRVKLKRFAKYHPEEYARLILIDADNYRALAKQVRSIVAGWESS